MNILLTLAFDYDAEDWAAEYGLPASDAAGDFANVVRRAVDDGSLRHCIDASWPMMRGRITVRTVEQLDAAVRDALLRKLREASDADSDHALLSEIRGFLADHQEELDRRDPRWVVFGTNESDNGHFLTGNGGALVYFADGTTAEVDFTGTCVDDLLTDAYGARGRHAALGVDLTTGAMEFDDHIDNMPRLLGIPKVTSTTADAE
jgi:hypothetical protein